MLRGAGKIKHILPEATSAESVDALKRYLNSHFYSLDFNVVESVFSSLLFHQVFTTGYA